MFQLCTKQTLMRDFCSAKPEKQFCPFISAWTECHSLTLVVNSIQLNITQLNVNHVYIWISMFTNQEKLYCCRITFNGYYSLRWSMCYQSLSPLQKRSWPFSARENAPNSLLQLLKGDQSLWTQLTLTPILPGLPQLCTQGSTGFLFPPPASLC